MRQLAQELFADNGQIEVMETAGLERAQEEPYVDLVSSAGWNETLQRIVIPLLHKIRHELLKDINLDAGRRQGDIRAIALIGLIITETYRRSGEQMPEWIRREIE